MCFEAARLGDTILLARNCKVRYVILKDKRCNVSFMEFLHAFKRE